MDGGGVGSGTTWVFARGPAGESPAAGDARACFFACASFRSGCFGVCSCSSATCGVGGGGGGGGVDGRGNPGGSSGGGGCAGACGVAARPHRFMMDLRRKYRTFAISAACSAARARDLSARADGFDAVSLALVGPDSLALEDSLCLRVHVIEPST